MQLQPPKQNSDRRCKRPTNCGAINGSLCRSCNCTALLNRLHANPAFAAKQGYLTFEQRATIAVQILTTRRPYVEIAEDWLISQSRVSDIAKEFNVQRRLWPPIP
jgi:hypothetical protein